MDTSLVERRPRLAATLVRALAITLTLVAAAPSARASRGAPEQLIPDATPIPTSTLWTSVSTFLSYYLVGFDNITSTATRPNPPLTEPRRSNVLDFPSYGRVAASGPRAGALLPAAAKTSPAGATVVVWYRNAGGDAGKIRGWNPIFALGKQGAAEPWRLALVLDQGVPAVSLKHRDGELFGPTVVPQDGNVERVDDGGWHHIALRVTREKCAAACPSVKTLTGYAVQPARFSLYVDGKWRGDAVADTPLDLDNVVLGELDTPGQTYAQTNFRASPPALRTTGRLSEFAVYTVPLAEQELAEIHDWQANGYVLQIPEAADVTPVTRSAVHVGAASLSDADLRAGAQTALGHMITPTTQWTAFAWLKPTKVVADASPATLLVSFGDVGGGAQVGLRASATGYVATCTILIGSTPQPSARLAMTAPGTVLDRMQLLALHVDGGTIAVRQDGVLLGTLTCPLLPRAGSQSLYVSTADSEVAWAGYFDRGLTASDLDGRVAPGPRIWEGTTTTSTATAPTELTDRPQTWTLQAAAGVAMKGGRYTNASASTTLPFGLRTAFPVGSVLAGDKAPFTVAMTVTIPFPERDPQNPLSALTLQRRVLLAWREPTTSYEPDFRLLADCVPPEGATFAFVTGCVLRIEFGADATHTGKVWTGPYLAYGQTYDLVVTSPVTRTIPSAPWRNDAPITRTEPLLVVDGHTASTYATLQNQKHQGEPQNLRETGTSPMTSTRTTPGAGTWNFGPGINGALYQAAGGAPWGAVYEVVITDPRVYSYVYDDVESVPLSRAARCGAAGRTSLDPAPAFEGDYCAECATGYWAIGGSTATVRDCREGVAFSLACAADYECFGGARCYAGRCLTTDRGEADTECGELKRVSVAEGGSWRCGGCVAGMTPLPNTGADAEDWNYACGWQPDKEPGDACTADAQCTTNKCLPARTDARTLSRVEFRVDTVSETWTDSQKTCSTATCTSTKQVPTPSYQTVTWSAPAECAETVDSGAQACAQRAVPQTTTTSTAPDGSLLTAVECKDGPGDACLPGFTREYRVMSPNACAAMLRDAATYDVVGECDAWYDHNIFKSSYGCNKVETKHFVSSKRNDALRQTDWLGFTPATLKLAVLGETSAFETRDVKRLRDAGIGQTLIDFAAADIATKNAMVRKYGDFLPLSTCGRRTTASPSPCGGYLQVPCLSYPPQRTPSAYEQPGNARVCEPVLQENDAPCPPPGAAVTGRPPSAFCESLFCDTRASQTCQDGGPTLTRSTGKSGDKQREGKSSVKFGIVRVDDTRVKVREGQSLGDEDPQYIADMSMSYVPCILGRRFPDVNLLDLILHVDRSEADCAENTFTTKVIGFDLPTKPPTPPFGSCSTSVAIGNNGRLCAKAGCEAPSFTDLEVLNNWQSLLPTVKACIPLEDLGVKLPEKKKTFYEAVVPIRVSIGLFIDACITLTTGFADSGLPQVEVTPKFEVGVEAKGGIGVGDDFSQNAGSQKSLFEASVGVKIELIIVGISFPIRWGMDLSPVISAGRLVPGLFKLEVKQTISLVLEILGGWMGLYAELALGPFGVEWELQLFSWTGFSFSFDLSEETLGSWTLDFEAEVNKYLGALNTQVPTPNCAACTQ